MTPLALHIETWKDCTRCAYAERRKRVVLGKGQVPCDIAFIGEAPGPSENVLGEPFVGKAGKILDKIISKVFGPKEARKYKIAYNNIIACIPLIEGDTHEKEEPDAKCVMECRPRLEEFIKIASPKLIVAVGKLSEEWLDQSYKQCVKIPKGTPVVAIQHPASILRMPPPAQPLAEHRCGVIISSAVVEHLEKRE